MKQYARQLRYFAERYPKSGSALLVVGTVISCGAIVLGIELRDRYKYNQKFGESRGQVSPLNNGQASLPKSSTSDVTPHEAQLAAMLENAKNSSWQQNLRNAADAQDRFMLPGRDVDEGREAPEYVKHIDKRSEEIHREENERRRQRREAEDDPSKTRFWR